MVCWRCGRDASHMPEAVELEVVAEDRPHAERSASQLPKLALCAGYIPAKGTKRTHWVTEQGLRGHAAMETESHDDLETDKEREMVELCEYYLSTLPHAGETHRELKVVTIEGRWGYIDELRLQTQPGQGCMLSGKADIVDWKFVRKAEPVDAEINLQGKDYVVGVFDAFSFVWEITVHFVAPRFGSVTKATFDRKDLPTLKLELLSILARAKATDRGRAAVARFTPEFDTCRFCGRLAKCPAVTAIGQRVAEAYTGIKIPLVPADVHSSKATDLKVLGALMMIADVLGPWVESVKAHAASLAKYDGLTAEGYELTYRKGQRKVTNPVALITLATQFGVTVDDILGISKVSLPALEKLVGAKAPRGLKAEKKREFLLACRDADAFERLEDVPFLQKTTTPAIALP